MFKILLLGGASALILTSNNSENPTFEGLEIVVSSPKTDFRIFGKPTSRPYRRMGVVLTYDKLMEILLK